MLVKAHGDVYAAAALDAGVIAHPAEVTMTPGAGDVVAAAIPLNWSSAAGAGFGVLSHPRLALGGCHLFGLPQHLLPLLDLHN